MTQAGKIIFAYNFLSGQHMTFHRVKDPWKTTYLQRDVGWRSDSLASCAVACMGVYADCSSFLYSVEEGLCKPGVNIIQASSLRNVSSDLVFWAPRCTVVGSYRLESTEIETVCLWFSNRTADYEVAKTNCKERGLQLITLKTTEKLTFFQETAARYVVNQAWIGLDDLAKEDDFRWADDQSLVPHQMMGELFSSGEPNNRLEGPCDQDCVAYIKSPSHFNDDYCASEKHFICEFILP